MSADTSRLEESMDERIRSFSEEVGQASRRMAAYRDPDLTAEPDLETFRAALGELQAQYEELCNADEELRAQVDELARLAMKRDVERQRYRELFDFAPDPYFVTNLWGLILDANVAATKLVGTEHKYLRGKPLAVVMDRDDVDRFRDVLAMIQSAQRVELEARLKSRKNDRESTPVTLVGATSEDGKRILWTGRPNPKAVGVAGDLGPGAEIDALARAVIERDETIAVERRLREDLETSHRSKDHFLAVLAHDLRSPLNAVLGWTQILRRDALEPAQRDKALAIIERNARAQAELVAELLDVSRLSTDKIALNLVPQSLADAAKRHVDAFAPAAAKKGVELTLEVKAGGHTIAADAARLDQIISNIVSNAIKFTPSGGHITVSVARSSAWTCLSVADDGCGVERDVLPRIFECFKQERRAQEGGQGLGLGLYIVKQLVELHGGRVKAESEGPNRGTTITVLLPAREGSVALDDEEPLATPDELEQKSVLVVEDDVDTRDLLITVLSQHGARVTAVGDARQALAGFTASPPDIIVSDIGLPEKDGYALIREIRATSNVPALALTAFAGPHDAQRAILAGFDAHIAKPVDPYVLVAAVATVLRSRRPVDAT